MQRISALLLLLFSCTSPFTIKTTGGYLIDSTTCFFRGNRDSNEKIRSGHIHSQFLLTERCDKCSSLMMMSKYDQDISKQQKVDNLISRNYFVTSAAVSAAVLLSTFIPSVPAAQIKDDLDSEFKWIPVSTYEETKLDRITYNPRFTGYLARLLLRYDSYSTTWWATKASKPNISLAQDFSKKLVEMGSDGTFRSLDLNKDNVISRDEFSAALFDQQQAFSEFQESIVFGLQKYKGQEGIRTLFKLLRQEFGESVEAKRQLALLFSLMDRNQPVELIRSLIGETDNGSIVGFNVEFSGSGYTLDSPPIVNIDPPPYGDDIAVGRAVLKPTGKILRIKLVSSGKGYAKVPDITVSPPSDLSGYAAKAIAIMKGDKVGSIIVTNPGKGYSDKEKVKVTVSSPFTDDENPEYLASTATAEALLDMAISEIKVVHKGSGYGIDLPIKINIENPSIKNGNVNFDQSALVKPILSEPPEKQILTSWLPPSFFDKAVTELLPDNLVPKLDPCLGKFYISPIMVLDPNYCVYYENSEFQVFPSEKFGPYFSFLDGPRARYPVEKEKELDWNVYLRFAASGATCAGIAHAILIPIDVVKTKMQSEPKKYRSMVVTFNQLMKENGLNSFLLGAGATIVGYFIHGGVSFGLTEYLKRELLVIFGPNIATLAPVTILLSASAIAAAFAATAVTPFESLRIKTVTIPSFPKSFWGSVYEVTKKNQWLELFNGTPVLLLSEIPFMMAKFATFDAVSKLAYAIYPQASESVSSSLLISLVCGMIAGVVAAIVSQPSDTILVAMNDENEASDPNSSTSKYSIIETIRILIESGGIKEFFKGVVPRAIKCAIGISIQFFLYDSFKRLLHVSPDDLKVFFDVMSGLEAKYN